jgi:hypothetical protein
MKLHEIIDKIDVKSLKAQSLEWAFFEEFDIYDVSNRAYNDDFIPRLKEYYFAGWQCTDTYVGARAIFFDDEFLCLGVQTARKSSEEFSYISKEKFLEFYKYLKSFEAVRVPEGLDVDMNEEFGVGYSISFSNEITHHKNVIYNGELCEIINKRPIDDYLCQVIEITYNNENIVVELKDVLFPYDLEI